MLTMKLIQLEVTLLPWKDEIEVSAQLRKHAPLKQNSLVFVEKNSSLLESGHSALWSKRLVDHGGLWSWRIGGHRTMASS